MIDRIVYECDLHLFCHEYIKITNPSISDCNCVVDEDGLFAEKRNNLDRVSSRAISHHHKQTGMLRMMEVHQRNENFPGIPNAVDCMTIVTWSVYGNFFALS